MHFCPQAARQHSRSLSTCSCLPTTYKSPLMGFVMIGMAYAWRFRSPAAKDMNGCNLTEDAAHGWL